MKKITFDRKTVLICIASFLIAFSIIFTIFSFFEKRFFAFDGAQGYGTSTDGGQYGIAYHVTSLEDNDKEGSLRYAISQPGAKLIVFDVSGIISLKSPLVIDNGNITIAGQTAPGDGICIKDNGIVITANNVIIRYIRIRPGKNTNGNKNAALEIKNAKNIIIDHCSISWANGGNVILNTVKNISVQWSFITENIGDFAILFTGKNKNISLHHNVFANNHSSIILFTQGYVNKNIDIRNNVFFNWDNFTINSPSLGDYNIVNNYYKYGPNTPKNNKNQLVFTGNSPKNIKMIYLKGNDVYLQPIVSQNNIAGVYPNDEFLKTAKNELVTNLEYTHSPIVLHPAAKVKQKVLEFAGASLRRDYPDLKIVKDIENYALLNVDLYTDFGIYPPYNSDLIFIDNDNDGIRDDWEVKNRLNPYSIMDAMDRNKKKRMFTNRDIYMDSFVKNITSSQEQGASLNLDTLKIKFYHTISNLK